MRHSGFYTGAGYPILSGGMQEKCPSPKKKPSKKMVKRMVKKNQGGLAGKPGVG